MSLASQPPSVRSPPSVAVLVVAVVIALAVPAVAVAPVDDAPAAPGGGPDATSSADGVHGDVVEGTVTDEDGDPVEGAYVLVQANGERYLQNATAGDEPVRRSLFELVDEHPFGLYWNTTTEDGSYTVHVPRPADYEVIAVTEDGVSRLLDVSVRVQRAERDLTVDPARVLSVEANGPSAASGDVATLELRVPNPGDDPVEGLSMTLSPPADWSVEGVETDGEYDQEAGRVTFERVEPGGVATATVRLRVPEGATRDVHDVGVTADARTHFVEHGDVGVRVAPPGAATLTPSATPTDERFTFDAPARPTDSQPTTLYLLSAGVFAVGVAFAGYSVWRTGLRVR